MFLPWAAWPLALQWIAVADAVPNLNVTPSCQGAARSGTFGTTEDRLQNCIASEQRTRDKLEKTWSSFSASDRDWCVSSIAQFGPTYTELASCLEMKRDLANIKPAEADIRPTTTPVRRP